MAYDEFTAKLVADNERLLAEIERLRAALLAIIAVSERHDKPTWNVVTDCARQALEGK